MSTPVFSPPLKTNHHIPFQKSLPGGRWGSSDWDPTLAAAGQSWAGCSDRKTRLLCRPLPLTSGPCQGRAPSPRALTSSFLQQKYGSDFMHPTWREILYTFSYSWTSIFSVHLFPFSAAPTVSSSHCSLAPSLSLSPLQLHCT